MYCILAVLLSRESEGRRREQDWCKSGKWLLPTGERAGANPQPLLSFSLFRPEEEANPKPSSVKSGGRGPKLCITKTCKLKSGQLNMNVLTALSVQSKL